MRILLATDLSTQAEIATTLLRELPLPPASRIRVVFAVEPMPSVTLFAPAPLYTITEATENEARRATAAVAERLSRPGVIVDAVVAVGRPADVVIRACQRFEPDLVIMGSRGRGAIATNVLGSVSAEVVDRSPYPVLIARRARLARFVLADDGTPNAAAGAHVVESLAKATNASVQVVSVVDAPFPMIPADSEETGTAAEVYREYQALLPSLRATHQRVARERAATLRAAGVAATSEQREGDATSELIAAARGTDADCIVLGTRGQTGLERMLLGSVARGVLYKASCSVLIAHAAVSMRSDAHELVGASSGREV